MKKTLGKSPPLRLDAKSYRELHRQVLERDGWRCQFCGSMQQLQVHHLIFRSHSGGDTELNLITLCMPQADASLSNFYAVAKFLRLMDQAFVPQRQVSRAAASCFGFVASPIP